MFKAILGFCLIICLLLVTCQNSAPTATPTPSPTPTLNSVPRTACDHPYWPLRPGARWEYTIVRANCQGDCQTLQDPTESKTVWQVTDVQGDTEFAYGTLVVQVGQTLSRTLEFMCNTDEIRFLNLSGIHDPGNTYQTCACVSNSTDQLGACQPLPILPKQIPSNIDRSWQGRAEKHQDSEGGTDLSSEFRLLITEQESLAGHALDTWLVGRDSTCIELPGFGGVAPAATSTSQYDDYTTIQLGRGVGITSLNSETNFELSEEGQPLEQLATFVTAQLNSYAIPPVEADQVE